MSEIISKFCRECGNQIYYSDNIRSIYDCPDCDNNLTKIYAEFRVVKVKQR